jgi:hypothetical protein
MQPARLSTQAFPICWAIRTAEKFGYRLSGPDYRHLGIIEPRRNYRTSDGGLILVTAVICKLRISTNIDGLGTMPAFFLLGVNGGW